MKYVILEKKFDGFSRIYPLIFAEHMTHSIMASSAIAGLKMLEKLEGVTLLTAGFCHMQGGEWACEHGSESLGIPKDASLNNTDMVLLNYPECMNGIMA